MRLTKDEVRELRIVGKISHSLLDCWQRDGSHAWQWCEDHGHIVPLAYARGGLPEVVGAVILARFIELQSSFSR